MRTDEDAWAACQEARARRARAEIAVIETRAAAAAAEREFHAAQQAEIAASDAWRRTVVAGEETGGTA